MYILFITILICCNGFCSASSSVELIKFLETEDQLIENLNGYVEKLKKKTILLEQSLLGMQAEHEKMNDDYETYLGNPLNSFRLIHRMHTDWKKWHRYSANAHERELVHIRKAHQMRKKLPTALDLEQASRGINDLVFVYDLKPEEIAGGNLAGYSKPETALSAQDCYALGEFSVRERKQDLAVSWFNASLAQFTADEPFYEVNLFSRSSVHKTWAVLLMKNQEHSILYKPPKESHTTQLSQWMNEEMITKPSCRGYLRQASRLFCRYNSSTTPFTRIAPLRMEELSRDPYMVIYHDVIYESEINLLLNTSKFELSLVETATLSEFRASQDSQIKSSETKVAKTLTQRVTDMTGLSMEMSDDFSLINYGLGGHFSLHTDYHGYSNQIRWKKGDRIATVLFYLGDVDSGGDTIFPMINVSVTPKKGSAVFWHNLHNSGDMNKKTLHSGCPVIVGSKYVLTKWINELPQMFSTPCINKPS
ncbi:prolyl 4-hydroxylase subunit alpha-2-like [Drosophila ficusphila]|uniref:prolyl 4-hydroxylase subunit alpha-2-like n=1 Tax=Drosophila ficusphila TaxID=30025 RepID=UPI0007E65C54|nr:prolyl 4-hydroxylase subunit alpha-2-like [Drosophila ficusphila]